MINFKNGACVDTRTEKQKEKDYTIKETVASVATVDWKEKSESEWRKFPAINQGSSGSCVMNTIKKLAGIQLYLKEKTYVDFSAAFYQLRSNKPSSGMIGVEAFEIWRKNGLPLEQLVPSEKMSDAEIDAIKIEQYKKDIAEVFKINNHVGIPNGDFETVASTIQQTGKGVMCWFYFTREEWAKLIPKVINQNLTISDGLRHSVTAVDFFLVGGKKYIRVEDSAHFNGLTEHIISEEFFKARNWFNRYSMNFKFEEGDENTKISKKLDKDLYFGMQDQDVVILQDLLKELGYYAKNIDSTGYYGAITLKAVKDFQLDKGIITSSNDAGAGRCGPKTRQVLNTKYYN